MKQILLILSLVILVSSCKDEKSAEIYKEETQTTMQKNLSKYVNVKLTADLSVLTEKEREMLPILIQAANKMNDLFWYESYGDKTELLNSITDRRF